MTLCLTLLFAIKLTVLDKPRFLYKITHFVHSKDSKVAK